MDRNDRALTAFTMLGHAMFHTYELVIPLFVLVWLDAFATTTSFLGVVVGASYALTGVGALGSAVAGFVLSEWSSAVLFGVLAVFALLAVLVGLVLVVRDG